MTQSLVPLYDNEDSVCGILYNNTPYYFVKNLQGDVIAIVDKDAQTVAKYSYDAWGVPEIKLDSSDCQIATVNPFCYRDYYYDKEIGLYYVCSRYYNPENGRFISTDKFMGANDDHSSYALYTYCGNCPVDRYDRAGFFWKKIWNGVKKAVRTVLNKTNEVLVNLGVNTAEIGAYFLNMSKDRQGIYHANFDCWQQYFGYNDFYDFMFDIGTSMVSKKLTFYSGKTWYVLWAWKGNYINLGAGAELGIYYGGEPHWRVDKNLSLDMSMTLQYKGAKIISYSAKTWWITGFNPKYLNVNASDLKVNFTFKFNSDTMYNDFWNTHKSCCTRDSKKKIISFTF